MNRMWIPRNSDFEKTILIVVASWITDMVWILESSIPDRSKNYIIKSIILFRPFRFEEMIQFITQELDIWSKTNIETSRNYKASLVKFNVTSESKRSFLDMEYEQNGHSLSNVESSEQWFWENNFNCCSLMDHRYGMNPRILDSQSVQKFPKFALVFELNHFFKSDDQKAA